MAGVIPCTSTDLIIGNYFMGLDGIDLGSTTGGVRIIQSNTYVEVENDQTPHLQAIGKISERWTVEATLQSVTLDKLRVVYGSKNDVIGTSLTIGGSETCSFPEEFELVICGPGPGCGCRNFRFPRVVFTPDTVEYVIQRDTPVQLPIIFTVLASCPDGDIAEITDVCDAFTFIAGTIPNYTP